MFGWEVIPRIGFGDFAVSPHGVMIAVGVFVGAWVMARRARRLGYSEDHVYNGVTWGVVGAILGARVAYVAGHLDQFASPLDWLKIWEGGISLVGGLLGAFSLVLAYTRRNGISFFELVDLGAPGLGIGIAVGRIGDLMIGDHLGKETSGWWGWEYQGGELISMPPCVTPDGQTVYSTPDGCIEVGTILHQTALYDLVWSLVIFGILIYLGRKPRGRGFLFLTWAALYASGRVATDFLRVDKTWLGLDLTGSQITSIIVLAVCAYLLVRFRGAPPPREMPVPVAPAGEPLAVQEEAAPREEDAGDALPSHQPRPRVDVPPPPPEPPDPDELLDLGHAPEEEEEEG